jgi:nucleoside-diphosphate-sugar epimerase
MTRHSRSRGLRCRSQCPSAICNGRITVTQRVLLTGATGFVGRALCDTLAAGSLEVRAVARHRGQSKPGVHWHEVDLLGPRSARQLVADVRPALLVHADWYVEHGRFWSAPENADWLEASTDLLAAFAELRGRRFISIGSCAEYAVSAGGDTVNAG